MGNASGKVGSALGTVAERDALEHAGVRCGAGHDRARWAQLGERWGQLRQAGSSWGKFGQIWVQIKLICGNS